MTQPIIRSRRGPFAGTRIIPLPGGYYIHHGSIPHE